MNKEKHNPIKGFTLIETMVVVLIIGILASIALPKYNRYVEKSKTTQAIITLKYMHDRGLEYMFTHKNNIPSPLTNKKLSIELPSDWDCEVGSEEETCCSKDWCFINNSLEMGNLTTDNHPSHPIAQKLKKGSTIDDINYYYQLEYGYNNILYCCESDEYCKMVAKEKTGNGCWTMH